MTKDATGPAPGGAPRYDPLAVAAQAMAKDPSLDRDLAVELAQEAWDELRDVGQLDAPEVARRLLAAHPSTGATPATQVASAAVEHCRAGGIDPAQG